MEVYESVPDMTLPQEAEITLGRAGGLWTAREIAQQPASWGRTHLLVQQQAHVIRSFLEPLRARSNLRIILTGAGSSAFIGECLAPLLLARLGGRVEAIATTDLLSGPHLYFQEAVPTLLVSFGRSGNSPESMAVAELAGRLLKECYQLVITCNEQGALACSFRERQRSLLLVLPPETLDKSFVMTSSFTSMMLAAWLAFCSEDTGARAVPVICAAGASVLEKTSLTLRELAKHHYSRVVYLGSNMFRGLAREAALKLLELTDGAVVAAFDSSLGFRHGPKTIVSGDTLIFLFLSNDPYTRRYDLDLLQELRRDGIAARVAAVTARLGDAASISDHIYVQSADRASDAELLFPYSICGQLYAFHRALELGNRPDEPSRSGTVNRVVRGVTVYEL